MFKGLLLVPVVLVILIAGVRSLYCSSPGQIFLGIAATIVIAIAASEFDRALGS